MTTGHSYTGRRNRRYGGVYVGVKVVLQTPPAEQKTDDTGEETDDTGVNTASTGVRTFHKCNKYRHLVGSKKQ
jgi:hypothetical protein